MKQPLGARLTAIFTLTLAVLLAVSTMAGPSRPDRGAMKQYRTDTKKFANQPIPLIETHMKYALQQAEKAKADNKPGFFGERGGIAQATNEAIRVKDGLSGPDQAKAEGIIKEYQAKIDAIEASFKSETLAGATAPEDVYKGSDRKEWEQKLRAAWMQKYPGDKIIKMIFNQAQWEHSKGQEWNKAYKRWEQYDKSVLKTAVVVDNDAETALIHPAFVNKDNMSGKVVLGVDTKESYGKIEILKKNL